MLSMRVIVSLLLVCTVASCTKRASSSREKQRGEAEEPVGYPRGPWWRGDINYTLFGVAHVLVSHRGAARSQVLLVAPGPAAERSRDEALALAKRLRAQLKRAPESFESIAREHSDDPSTAPLGGMMGEVYAPHLPDAIVDALGNLKPGEISRVVETDLGFHVLKRVAVRPETVVEGSQITIGYAGTETVTRPGKSITRSRSEAKALADRVYAMAIAAPSRFAELAREYSDSHEGAIGGDIGQWSTQARSGEPLPLLVLRDLEVGGIAKPVETARGFRILRRDPHRERPLYAMAALIVASANRQAPDAPPPEKALEIAKSVAERARAKPESFDQLRQEHCDYSLCSQPGYSFQEGYWMFASAFERIRGAKVGEIIAEPLETPLGYAVVRREDAAKYPQPAPPPVKLELPVPPMPSLETATAGELLWYLGQLRNAVRAELNLDEADWKKASLILDNLAISYGSLPVEQRVQITADANTELAMALGPAKALEIARLNERLLHSFAGRTLER